MGSLKFCTKNARIQIYFFGLYSSSRFINKSVHSLFYLYSIFIFIVLFLKLCRFFQKSSQNVYLGFQKLLYKRTGLCRGPRLHLIPSAPKFVLENQDLYFTDKICTLQTKFVLENQDLYFTD